MNLQKKEFDYFKINNSGQKNVKRFTKSTYVFLILKSLFEKLLNG